MSDTQQEAASAFCFLLHVFYWKLGELIEIYKRQLQKVYHIFNLPTFYLFIVCDYLKVEIWIAS